MTLLGVDTGGTFTDFVLLDEQGLRSCKVLSTPDAPERAILQGMAQLGLDGSAQLSIVHGSTVATNAVLERKGVKTLFVTNHGLTDMLEIGRQARAELYNLQPQLKLPLLGPEQCVAVGGRIDRNGDISDPLTATDIERLLEQVRQQKPRAVAINLIFSWKNPETEQALKQALNAVPGTELFISSASDVLPRSGEYERGMATWLNAYVGPLVQGYLQRLGDGIGTAALSIMQSNAGTCDAQFAGEQAVNLLLSGPAGGLQAASFIGELTGSEQLLTFDMGGTSTDVAMIDGRIILTDESQISGLPVAVPMVDMHTIGAGGGSLAWLDEAGVLQVGPESAGARPGPACYGQGGRHATVTDANVVLGHMPAETRLGGSLSLDRAAAEAVIGELAAAMGLDLETTAHGIIELANEHMVQALRVISVQRGVDPRRFTLVSFGGAGGLHVCALADALGMRRALAPVNGGVLSALGMLVAPRSRELVQAVGVPLAELSHSDIDERFERLMSKGREGLLLEGVRAEQILADYSVDLRYQGQSFTLNLPWGDYENLITEFHRAHQQRYGYDLNEAVELINVRLGVSGPEPSISLPKINRQDSPSPLQYTQVAGQPDAVPVWERHSLSAGQRISGPAVIAEAVSTTWVAPGWECMTDEWSNLVLEKNSAH